MYVNTRIVYKRNETDIEIQLFSNYGMDLFPSVDFRDAMRLLKHCFEYLVDTSMVVWIIKKIMFALTEGKCSWRRLSENL